MASFSVQYIFGLVDRFTPGARKLGSVAKAMSVSVHSAGRAANAAASGVSRYGAAAAAAARHVEALTRAAARSHTALGRHMRSVGRRGENLGVMGGLGVLTGGYTGLRILQEAREASKAENKFRALVDNATDDQMRSLREAISSQMIYTGEKYAELMDAAADAAQIVGNADLARGIMQNASSLARIDTAKKDTAYFANALASVVGPNGTIEEVIKLADMMAKQQKLGAATAGGTIEAYKNVAALRTMTGFDPVAMFAAFGLMKNLNSAIKDGEMGTWAQYGIRMLTMPNSADSKKLKGVGLDPKMFLDQLGNFDIAKAHSILYAMKMGKNGDALIKKLFSGRNVNAQKFWGMLLGVSPEKFKEFMLELQDSAGTVWDAVLARNVGLDGAMTNLEGAARKAAIAIGSWLTPAIQSYATIATQAAMSVSPWLDSFQQSYPMLSQFSGMALVAAVGLSALAIPLAAVAFSLRMIGAGVAIRMLAGLVSGAALGAAGGVATLGKMANTIYRVAGAAALAKFALRGALRLVGIGLLIEGLIQAYQHWDKLKAFAADPVKFILQWEDNLPTWLVDRMKGKPVQDQRARKTFDNYAHQADYVPAYDNVVNLKAYREAQRIADEARRTYTPIQQMQTATVPEQSWFKRVVGADPYDWSNAFSNAQPHPAMPAAAIPQSMAVKVTSHTSFDPASLTVTYNGPIQGPAAVPISAKPARGVSASDAGTTSGE